MIAKVVVEGLFGKFNYDISFTTGINIITGPNGYGKTTILKMINYILEDNYYELSRIPFKRFIIESYKKTTLTYEHKEDGFYCENEKVYIPDDIEKSRYSNKIRLKYKDEELLNKGYNSFYINSDDSIRSKDVKYRSILISDIVIISDLKIKNFETAPYVEKLFKFCSEVGNSSFLEANRLYGLNSTPNTLSLTLKDIQDDEESGSPYEIIDTLNKRMESEMAYYIERYTMLSNYYDSIFFEKLGQIETTDNSYSKEEFDKDKTWINDFTTNLLNYGLLTMDDVKVVKRAKYNEKFDAVYKLFMEQFTLKTSIFIVLIKKIDLFKKLINNCLIDKEININSKKEIIVIDKKTKENLKLLRLSSGEKEIIIMYFSLLFNSNNRKRYKLFLIDEPEISLHIEWQYKFLDDLEEIENTNLDKHQFIVCTHSPQIINERWKSTIDLTKTMFKI